MRAGVRLGLAFTVALAAALPLSVLSGRLEALAAWMLMVLVALRLTVGPRMPTGTRSRLTVLVALALLALLAVMLAQFRSNFS